MTLRPDAIVDAEESLLLKMACRSRTFDIPYLRFINIDAGFQRRWSRKGTHCVHIGRHVRKHFTVPLEVPFSTWSTLRAAGIQREKNGPAAPATIVHENPPDAVEHHVPGEVLAQPEEECLLSREEAWEKSHEMAEPEEPEALVEVPVEAASAHAEAPSQPAGH